jgi:hypothetical protein
VPKLQLGHALVSEAPASSAIKPPRIFRGGHAQQGTAARAWWNRKGPETLGLTFASLIHSMGGMNHQMPVRCGFRFLVAGTLCFVAASTYAIDPTVVVPNSSRGTETLPSLSFPFDIGPHILSMRYQQLYAASQFASIGSGGLITQIVFRPDTGTGKRFRATLPDVQINLSTTSVADDALSLTFADNVGADDTVVFSGPLPLQSKNRGSNPKDFDIVINLTTPFFYDPTKGNLLLDVRNFGGGMTTFFDSVSASGDGVSRVDTNIDGDVNSPVANYKATDALVTGFKIR